MWLPDIYADCVSKINSESYIEALRERAEPQFKFRWGVSRLRREYTLILNKFIHTFFISVFSHSICFPRLNVRRLFPSMLCSYLRPTNQHFLALKALSHKVLCSFNTHTTNTQDNFPSLDKIYDQ